MTNNPVSDRVAFTRTVFQLTVDDALQFPARKNPSFPPFCIQCEQPATAYVEKKGEIKKQIGDATFVQTSKGAAQQTQFAVEQVLIKLPYCTQHFSESKMRERILLASVFFGIILGFIFAFLFMGRINSPELPHFLLVGIIIVGVTFLVHYLVSKLLYRVYQIGRFDWHSFYGKDRLEGPKRNTDLMLVLHNASYAKKFAEINNWEPLAEVAAAPK
jgi:hypothetical protein